MKIYANELERAIETKIKPNLKMVYNLRIKGLNDKHIAKYLGIPNDVFQKAIQNDETIKEVYEDATMLLCSELRNVAISRALGTDGKTDANGNEVGPDANLAVRLLEKLDPVFSKKEEVTVNITVEDVIRQLNEKRRMEIEKQESLVEKNTSKGITVYGT